MALSGAVFLVGGEKMDALDAVRVADIFHLGRPIGALEFVARGQLNPLGVHRLLTDKGCFAVKQFDAAPRTAALAIEATAFKMGLPIPEPMQTRDGQPFATFRTGERTLWIRVYRWVPSAALHWGCVEPEIAFEVGKLMAAIHRLPVAEEDLVEQSWSPLTETGWTELTERARARQLPWADELHRAMPILLKLEAYLVENTSNEEAPVPSQRDLHPPNIVRTPDSALFVVDWDSAGPAIARHDVAEFALVWATPEGGQPLESSVHAFIDGYREGGGRYASQGPTDLLHKQQTSHWWLVYNIKRDVSDRSGPDAELTPALLRKVASWDTDRLKRLAELLDY